MEDPITKVLSGPFNVRNSASTLGLISSIKNRA